MKDEKPKLPITNQSFISDVKTLFSLSTEDIKRLIASLEERRTLFSTIHVCNLLKLPSDEAGSIRTLLTFLIHEVHEHQLTEQQLHDELVKIDVERKKVSVFAGLFFKLSKVAMTSGDILYGVRAYMSTVHVLASQLVELNYTNISHSEMRKQILIPVFSLTLVSSYDEHVQSMRFDMDANELQTFIRSLQESLAGLKDESEVLKASLGEKYTQLVVEQDGYTLGDH